MLRKWFKKHFLNKNSIKTHSSMNVFQYYLRHPNIWYLNCMSVSRGTAVGLFVAFIPLPLQMLLAGFLAVIFRANLPIAVSMTWITNPFTFIPINYFVFWVGKKILGKSMSDYVIPTFEWQFGGITQFWHSLLTHVSQLGKAYFIGLPVVAIGVSTLGYLTVRIVWYFSVSFSKQKRVKKK